MIINEKLLKPLKEVNYLRAENFERYRTIVRFFYEEYEKIRYYLYRDDIYQMMVETELFPNYTLELCQSDLDALTNWKNLIAIQDTAKVTTLQEFKNRKYRYQLSGYTIEIERMTQRLELLEIEGASLEPSLLERIRKFVMDIPTIVNAEDQVASAWWNDLSADFIRLNRNYQDYIRTLNGAKAEEMMKSEHFIIYKEQIIKYLRSFVKNLQEEGLIIESYLKLVDDEDMKQITEKIITYEKSIPRIDFEFDEPRFRMTVNGRWQSVYSWFVSGEQESEINRMGDITLEIIRKITRYAQQIGEFYHQGANKKEEYRHIASIFGQCETVDDAHKLSAMIFGAETCLHFTGLKTRTTDSIYSGVYEEPSTFVSLESRTRIARAKKQRVPAENYAYERMIQQRNIMDEQKRQQELLQSYIQDNEISFSNLPVIDAYSRKVLLSWLSKALATPSKRSQTEWGQFYIVDTSNDEKCVLRCQDGILTMPSYRLIFEETGL